MAKHEKPSVIVQKTFGAGPLSDGKEFGIEVVLEGAPTSMILAFNTATFASFLPFLLKAFSETQKLSGAKTQTTHFIATEAAASISDDEDRCRRWVGGN